MRVQAPSKDVLVALRKIKTRAQIAEEYGVSIATVRRWIQRYKIQRKRKRFQATGKKMDFGMSKLERAKQILAARLVEKREGYFIDGQPVSADRIIELAGIKD